jgi:putative flippase GtrA
MFKQIWALYKKYQEPINYLIVGGIGTVVSIAAFALLLRIADTVTANIISWIIVVILMYILNRYFVFSEHAKGFSAIIREIISFVSARVATLILETFIVWLGIDVMHFNAIIIKTIGQILVIVLNYVASKLFIFKNSGSTHDKAEGVGKKAGNRKV